MSVVWPEQIRLRREIMKMETLFLFFCRRVNNRFISYGLLDFDANSEEHIFCHKDGCGMFVRNLDDRVQD
jgi:hypothetical protein